MNTVNAGVLNLSQIGLGTFPLKGETLQNALTAAVNNGYGLIDTAYKYQNETEIGNFLCNNNHIVVQTKLSVTQLSYKKFLWLKFGNKSIKNAIEGSMERLRKQSLDVYLLHSPAKDYVDLYGDLKEFRTHNKVKAIGVCRFNEHQLQDIRNKHGEYPTINQIEVHPFCSNKRVIDFCKKNGIVVEARSLFTHGDAMQELMQSDILNGIAKEYNKSVPQIIVRWVIQQGLVAIVKSCTPNHIKENVDVFDFCLTDKQMSMIDSMNRNQSFGVKSKVFNN
jgi:diketogulonate reductase-like aldo/keto reductase